MPTQQYTAYLNPDNRAIADCIRPLYGSLVIINEAATADITDATAHDVVNAPGANLYNAITFFAVTNASATGTWVKIIDGTGNVMAVGYAGPGNGFVYPIPGNTPLYTETANSKIQIQCETAGAQVRYTIAGYVASPIG